MLSAVAGFALARGDDTFQTAGLRVAAIAFVVLVAALVLDWPVLVPVAVVGAGGLYGAQLAVDDARLDLAAPAVAAALLLTAELAYWSLEERERIAGEPGETLRRAGFVALLGIGALLVTWLPLVVVDVLRARGIALDVVGAVAAVGALAVIVLVTRRPRLADESEARR